MSEQQNAPQHVSSPNQMVNAILAILFGSLLYLPVMAGIYTLLWNYAGMIGKALVILFGILVLFALWYAVVWLFTGLQMRWSLSYTTHISSSLVQRGGIVVHINEEGYVRNLSAEVVEAGSKQLPVVAATNVNDYRDNIEYMYDQGVSPKQIAEAMRIEPRIVTQVLQAMRVKEPKQERELG
jgi:ABC-type transport system involved in multi-copper enzyme maturation permease subunit